MSRQLSIDFGALSSSIAEQLTEQGVKFDYEQIRLFQRDVDAVTRCLIRDLIPDGAGNKARAKLMKRLVAVIESQAPDGVATKPTVQDQK